MNELESLFIKYYKSVVGSMLDTSAPFYHMKQQLLKEFEIFGLTNEEKARALSQIYAQEIQNINNQAADVALKLIAQEDSQLTSDKQRDLIDNQILTEERKKQGYDDNILIEIMKAQGSLASFAVNANSDTAQDTIDDLKSIMKVVEDRVCDIVCDTPSFNLEYTTPYDTPVTGNIFGGSELDYTVVEEPQLGSLTVNDTGSFTYTPQNDIDGVGIITFKIRTTDDNMSVITSVIVNVTDIATPRRTTVWK